MIFDDDFFSEVVAINHARPVLLLGGAAEQQPEALVEGAEDDQEKRGVKQKADIWY